GACVALAVGLGGVGVDGQGHRAVAVAGQVGESVAEVFVGADGDGLATGGVITLGPGGAVGAQVEFGGAGVQHPLPSGGVADQEFARGVVEVFGGLAALGELGEP